MLQQAAPADFVIATGRQISVRRFVELAAAGLGISLAWEGRGIDEIGRVASTGDTATGPQPGDIIVRIDPRYFRPTEVDTLLGDPTKAREKLGWTATTPIEQLVAEMVEADLRLAERDALVAREGYRVFDHHE
jgi:GDPmannose 4,6-dehydratase